MSAQIEVQIIGLPELTQGLADAGAAIQVEQEQATVDSVLYVEGEVKLRTPMRTGRLRSAWLHETTSSIGGTVGRVHNEVQYGPDVEYGTVAHDIVPSNKKALYWKGAGHPVRRVRHPGTRGVHMAAEGLQASRSAILTIFTNAMSRAMAVVGRGGK